MELIIIAHLRLQVGTGINIAMFSSMKVQVVMSIPSAGSNPELQEKVAVELVERLVYCACPLETAGIGHKAIIRIEKITALIIIINSHRFFCWRAKTYKINLHSFCSLQALL